MVILFMGRTKGFCWGDCFLDVWGRDGIENPWDFFIIFIINLSNLLLVDYLPFKVFLMCWFIFSSLNLPDFPLQIHNWLENANNFETIKDSLNHFINFRSASLYHRPRSWSRPFFHSFSMYFSIPTNCTLLKSLYSQSNSSIPPSLRCNCICPW